MNRRDWRIGRLHVIKREYNDSQWGALFYADDAAAWWHEPTLDIWLRRPLITLRWMPRG